MANLDLAGVLTKAGAPFLKKIIEGSLPAPWNQAAGPLVDILAERLGAPEQTAEAVVERYNANPNVAGAIIQEVEADPSVILAGVEQQRETNALLLAEMKEPLWTWAWRPAGMWGLGVLWFWNIIGLHALNAIFKIALPPTDNGILFQLSALYMGLYMGGHTVKDFVAKKWGGVA
ncbi:hypothetical protein [Devosia sp.]|uniref:hypothetical protein n=1 Tax=Devosia sp. TaxID=1871048 RepID=UPI001AC0AF74|nr:hypothetical protein [Devosia sp.]MBN9334699.1 hypothetical protein [Devosia sp.]